MRSFYLLPVGFYQQVKTLVSICEAYAGVSNSPFEGKNRQESRLCSNSQQAELVEVAILLRNIATL